MAANNKKKWKTMHFTEMLNSELQDASASKMREMLKILMDKALVEKDISTIWKIIERVEGTAKQHVTIAGDVENPFQAILLNAEDLRKKLLTPTDAQVEAVFDKITKS
jgi:hypothetical protein